MGDLGDRGGEHGGHAGVHGVAAAGQHPHSSLGCEVASRGHHADAGDDFWSVGRGAAGLLAARIGTEATRGDGHAEDGERAEGSVCSHGFLLPAGATG